MKKSKLCSYKCNDVKCNILQSLFIHIMADKNFIYSQDFFNLSFPFLEQNLKAQQDV